MINRTKSILVFIIFITVLTFGTGVKNRNSQKETAPENPGIIKPKNKGGKHEEVEVIFPMHRNPKVRSIVQEVLGDMPRVHLIEPLEYEPFANLMDRTYLIMTDSGGIQEEAPSLGKPVLVLRDTTERPEAVQAGTVKLVGTDKATVYSTAKELITNAEMYTAMSNAVNPYGDGLASERIVQALRHEFFEHQEKPSSFGK